MVVGVNAELLPLPSGDCVRAVYLRKGPSRTVAPRYVLDVGLKPIVIASAIRGWSGSRRWTTIGRTIIVVASPGGRRVTVCPTPGIRRRTVIGLNVVRAPDSKLNVKAGVVYVRSEAVHEVR